MIWNALAKNLGFQLTKTQSEVKTFGSGDIGQRHTFALLDTMLLNISAVLQGELRWSSCDLLLFVHSSIYEDRGGRDFDASAGK